MLYMGMIVIVLTANLVFHFLALRSQSRRCYTTF